MTEKQTYTTGEMIDQLQMGDTATSDTGVSVGYDPSGILYCWFGTELEEGWLNASPFSVSKAGVSSDAWTLNRKFVSFQEAMDAYTNDNKTVIFYQEENLQYEFASGVFGHFERLNSDNISLEELVNGRWIVVNRSRRLNN